MTRKLIKKLALASYSKNKLDSKKVNKIVKLLNRKELKTYIKTVKNYESARTVTFLTPRASRGDEYVSELRKMFPGKRILVKQDDSLIAGIRIVDNDTIYDFNIRNTLQNLVSYINQ
ncbi:MAG: hypothetical protein M1444_04005 [Patescibacteria group bacterium]|nr:hypothetical protein [Patescibacteria group bacterium]